jgi:hypothetical protein
MATAEMDFREVSEKLGDGPEETALKELLDALSCTLESIEIVAANYHKSIADVLCLYKGLAANIRLLLHSTMDG